MYMGETENPKISVIVPVYNVERYLKKCIDSILAQTYQNFELILVDDGSEDNSGMICDSYKEKDNRIQVIHKINGGLSDARNAGIEVACGEYLSFIDSDDWVHPDFLRVLYDNANVYNADISVVNLHKEYDDGRIEKIEKIKEELLSKKDALKNLYDAGIYMNVACNKLYKKSLFSDIKYPVGKLHEDGFTTYKLLYKANSVFFSDRDLYSYYQRKESIMNQTFSENRIHEYEVYQERTAFFEHEDMNDLLIRNERTKNACIRTLTVKIIESDWSKEKKEKWFRFFRGEVQKIIPYLKKKDSVLAKVYCVSPKIFYWTHKVKDYLRFIKNINRQNKIMAKFIFNCVFAKIFYRNNSAFLMLIPIGGNLGDQAIVIAEEQLLSDIHFIEMPCSYFDVYWKYKSMIQKFIGKSTIVFTGGGNMGTLWYDVVEVHIRRVIEIFKNNKIVMLPNSCYYENSRWGRDEFKKSKEIYNSHKALYIFARENISYQYMKNNYKNVYLMPDLVMYLHRKQEERVRSGALLCLRGDCEQTLSEQGKNEILKQVKKMFDKVYNTDTVVPGTIKKRRRNKAVSDKLDEFSKAELVVTDRLHGMVFAAITGTPCIVVNSISHKLKGCYEWIKNLEYIRFIENIDEIKDISKQIVGRCYIYDNSHLMNYYEDLKQFVYAINKGEIREWQKEER